MPIPVLKRWIFFSQETKEHYKVDENNGMFEKECEEEVDDDLPATQWFVSPQSR